MKFGTLVMTATAERPNVMAVMTRMVCVNRVMPEFR